MLQRPTRFDNGVNNLDGGHPLNLMPSPLSSELACVYEDDFITWDTGHWNLAGAGTPTRAQNTTLPNGVLDMGTTTASSDSNTMCTDSACWQFVPGAGQNTGKTLFARVRFRVDNATSSRVVFGFTSASTAAAVLATTFNGIVFDKAAGATSFVLKTGDGTTQLTSGTLGNMADATYITLAIVFDGTDLVAYVNDAPVYRVTPGGANVAGYPLNATLLFGALGVLTSTAAARTLSVDRVLWGGERN